MNVELRRLTGVDRAELLALLNDPRVRHHMPLATETLDDAGCAVWVAAKDRIWDEKGYGPWAFYVDGVFVGWGGLEPEGEDVDLALVLRPEHWGKALTIHREILRETFGPLGLSSVIILLPPSRKHIRGVLRLGYKPDGETVTGGQRFRRFRLHAPGYWALIYYAVEDYVSRRAAYREEHLRLARAAADRWELVLGGAFSEPVDQALLVFRSSREAVEDFVRRDPYVRNGLVTKWVIRPWTVVVGAAASGATPPIGRPAG